MLRTLQDAHSRSVDGTDFLLIVGMQKSGTTLLMRLLEASGGAANAFDAEGDEFWGNTPPFSPDGFPAGAAYQQSSGERGHRMTEADATAEAIAAMHDRYVALPPSATVRFNKNPYNTLRLPWLRAVFPRCRIVAMTRHPVANVYSLAKKHEPHEGRGLGPSDGWWGVKPPGWRQMIRPDVFEQCALQWNAVNAILADDQQCIDMFVSYEALCAQPRVAIEQVLALTGARARSLKALPETLPCMDREFERGSALRSKNIAWLERKEFSLREDASREMAAMTQAQIRAVQHICAETATRFPLLAVEASR